MDFFYKTVHEWAFLHITHNAMDVPTFKLYSPRQTIKGYLLYVEIKCSFSYKKQRTDLIFCGTTDL